MPLSTDTATDNAAGQHAAGQHAAGQGGAASDVSHSQDSSQESGDGSIDVVSSAASPTGFQRPVRWDTYILFNVAIPILLVLAGVFAVQTLGSAKAKPLPPPDFSPAAVLKRLPQAEVRQVLSLKETGKQLELIIDGTVVPFLESRISSEVAGRVVFKSEKCEAGAIVKKGDPLMEIDPTDYEVEVERLKRLQEQEYRAIGEVDQQLINTQRSIDLAKKDVQLQQQEVDRIINLKSFTSAKELDTAKRALLQSEQQLQTLNNEIDLLNSRRSRLESAEKLAGAQLRAAELNLSRCTINAPISGVIVSEEADLNSFVSRGTTLVTIEDTSKVEVAANMRMDQLHWVLDQKHANKEAGYDLPDTTAIIEYEVAGRSGAVRRWQGMLVSYDGIGIDPNTRTVPVRIVVDDPTHYVDDEGKVKVADRANALLRGMFVRVRLQLVPETELIVVPAKALRPGNRVWRFGPDETVVDEVMRQEKEALEKSLSSEEESTASSPQSEADGSATDDVEEDDFDPTQWTAGRVNYSDILYPVDSLQLSDGGKKDENLSPSLQTADRDWVCESVKSDLRSGDWVVVSPLDAIPSTGLPARANLEK